MSKWISVKDRVPENRAKVLICSRSKNGVRNSDIDNLVEEMVGEK